MNITTMISTWDLVMDWICMYTFYLTQIECVDLRTQAQYNLLPKKLSVKFYSVCRFYTVCEILHRV